MIATVPLIPAEEGWDIFETGGGDHAPWEIQCEDFPEDDDGNDLPRRFHGDSDAWTYVVIQAAAGSELHAAALFFLKRESPEELAAIRKHAQENDLPWPDALD